MLLARSDGGELEGGSDLPVYDGGPRRQNSHGLFEPVCDGGLVKLKDNFRLPSATMPIRIVMALSRRRSGLMNPNHYLAVAIQLSSELAPQWNKKAAVGKTLVSSCLIDRVVERLGRKLFEVPVGFKWFSPGLFDGTVCFGGEESAGASFLCKDGTVWTTDKDGIILCLLAAEMIATTGRDAANWYEELTRELGRPYYSPHRSPRNCRSEKRS